MDFDEPPFGQHRADHVALGAERRDERGDHDQPGIDHQLGHFADAADILDPVGLGEAQILVEPVADIVAVEQKSVSPDRVKLLLDEVGDGRFARPRQAGEP